MWETPTLSSLCFDLFRFIELYPGLKVFLLCFLSLPPVVGPRLFLSKMVCNEVRKDIQLPPCRRHVSLLKRGTLAFMLAILVGLSLSGFACTSLMFLATGRLFFHSIFLLSIPRFFSLVSTAGQMPRNLENTSCHQVPGLHKHWYAAVACPSTAHH